MSTHKDRKSKREPEARQRKSRIPSGFVFPSERQRLPAHIPGTYQVAMGNRDEIAARLRSVPRETRAILISFSNEASYRIHGPIFWHVAKKLPEIVVCARRRRFEKLVDALTQLLQAPPGAASAAASEPKTTPSDVALPSRSGDAPNEHNGREVAMGALDDVLCNNDLFGKHKGETHYTASLDPVFPGSVYEITPAGRLELLECTYEDRSDPHARGWERLSGMLTPVFSGDRRDIGMHGWINFPGFGRAKFTEGTLVAFEPEVQSSEPDQLPATSTPPGAGVQSDSDSALERAIDVAGGGPAEYLRCFFSELERLKCPLICDVSHAIGFRDGKLYVLMSIGDFRERVYIQDLDKDPASAAQDVYVLWRTTPRIDEEIE